MKSNVRFVYICHNYINLRNYTKTYACKDCCTLIYSWTPANLSLSLHELHLELWCILHRIQQISLHLMKKQVCCGFFYMQLLYQVYHGKYCYFLEYGTMCSAVLFVGLSSISVVHCCFCLCCLWTVIQDNVIVIVFYLMLYFFEGQVVHTRFVDLGNPRCNPTGKQCYFIVPVWV